MESSGEDLRQSATLTRPPSCCVRGLSETRLIFHGSPASARWTLVVAGGGSRLCGEDSALVAGGGTRLRCKDSVLLKWSAATGAMRPSPSQIFAPNRPASIMSAIEKQM